MSIHCKNNSYGLLFGMGMKNRFISITLCISAATKGQKAQQDMRGKVKEITNKPWIYTGN